MAVVIPCPQCGKMLKLQENMRGKTIRCPPCRHTFKVPPAALPSDPPEVLEVTAATESNDEPPVLEAVENDDAIDRRIPAVQAAKVREPERRKELPAKSGWGTGVLLTIGAVLLLLCGGFGTLTFLIGKAILNAGNPTTSQIASPNPRPSPPPNPQPNPNPNPQPNPNPPPNPNPNPNPNPVAVPAPEQLKRDGDRLTVHAGGTQMVRTLPDGKMLAAVGEDGTVTLLELPRFANDPMTYGVHRRFAIDRKPFRGLAFHPSSQMAVVAGDRLDVYNTYLEKIKGSVTCNEPVAAVFVPSGTALVFAVQKPDGKGSELRVWDTQRHRESAKPLSLSGKVTHLDHSVFPTYSLAAAEDDKVHLYSLSARNRDFFRSATINTGQGSVRDMAFNPRSQDLITIGDDRTVKRWAAKDGKYLRSYEGAANPSGRPAFTPDGSRLAVLDGDKVRLWHTASGTIQATLDLAPAQGGNIDFLRDNKTMVIALRNQPIRFWTIPDVKEPVRPAPPQTQEPVRPTPPPRFGKAERPEEVNRFQVPIAIQMVGFSPDGKTLAASDREGELMLLNVADWTRRAGKTSAAGPRGRGRGPALTFAYGGDGRLVCAGGGGKSARIYLRDGVSGEQRSDFPAGDGWVRCLAVSSDGKRLAVGFESRPPLRVGDRPRETDTAFVRLWDISDQPKPLGTLEKLSYPLGGVAFDRSGNTLHIAAGNLVRRWRIEPREEMPTLEGALGDLAAVVVASDGHVYAAGSDLMIHSWDAAGRHAVPWEGHRLAMHLGGGRDGGVTGLALTADGKRLASVACDRTCRLWDTATGETIAVTEDKSQGGPVAYGLPAFSPDGKLLLVAADYNTVSVLQTERLKGKAPVPPLPAKKDSAEPGAVAAIAPARMAFFSLTGFSDDTTLLTANPNGSLQRWNWPQGTLRDEIPHSSSIQRMAHSRDGKVVALGVGSAVYLRDGATGKLLATVPPPPGKKTYEINLPAIALSPQGDLLALSRGTWMQKKNPYELIIWDVKQGRPQAVIHPSNSVVSLAFSPDGKTLVAGLSTGGVALYDPPELKERRVLAQQKSILRTMVLSPDGKRIATSSDNGQVTMWDLAEGKELWSKPWSQVHAGQQPVIFSSDGKWLVSARMSKDQGLVMVDAASGNLRLEVTRHPMTDSNSFSFSPDGKYLAVAQKSPNEVVVYEVAKLLAQMP